MQSVGSRNERFCIGGPWLRMPIAAAICLLADSSGGGQERHETRYIASMLEQREHTLGCNPDTKRPAAKVPTENAEETVVSADDSPIGGSDLASLFHRIRQERSAKSGCEPGSIPPNAGSIAVPDDSTAILRKIENDSRWPLHRSDERNDSKEYPDAVQQALAPAWMPMRQWGQQHESLPARGSDRFLPGRAEPPLIAMNAAKQFGMHVPWPPVSHHVKFKGKDGEEAMEQTDMRRVRIAHA